MEKIDLRTEVLFKEQRQAIYRRTDRLFAALMLIQWFGALVAAFLISPRAWEGTAYAVHIHLWAALFLGGLITLVPVFFALKWPGETITRHLIACGQMLMSALLIHLTGGRIETHFHVFGSLAFIAFYRDWRVLLSATLIGCGRSLFPRRLLAPVGFWGPGGEPLAVAGACLLGGVRGYFPASFHAAKRPGNARDGRPTGHP